MNAPGAPAAVQQAVSVVSLYQKQAKIYPRSVQGRFARLRWVMVWVTQAVFYGLPWLTWNGRQAVLFDLDAPRFYVLGLVLLPQDLIFLAALLVIAALALFFFTAVAGRLWCGYACPQTVYTEIFLWIERHTEGDRAARMRLDAAPWGARKLLRKGGKHALWALVAGWTGFTFVGYFLPVRELAAQAATLSLAAWPTFWVLFYGAATYGNAGWMREQICKYMCPYARLQSTMIDADSLVIAYDGRRGEPRGSRPRRADAGALGLGACLDCTLCVQVCPTGIDIRNGLQNECIGCAACIDACDEVMDKMGYARGLVRYATANAVAGGWDRARMLRRLARPRVLAYGTLLLAAAMAFVLALALRSPASMDVMRDRGTLARLGEDGRIENVYRAHVVNRTEHAARYRLGVDGPMGLVVDGARSLDLRPGEVQPFTVRLAMPAAEAARLGPGSHAVTLTLAPVDGADPLVREATTFIVPR
ncbi:MAG: cytochrome c oxidase accessory protein CcoG [Rubrivivax sp.]|nr:cytochrome c oxidase accessory protein CcoG [Rubrivivax sp.]